MTREHLSTQNVAYLAHELRTPPTAMSGYIELLGHQEHGMLSDKQYRFLSIIQEQVEQMLSLIHETLDPATLEDGQLQLHKTDVHLPSLIERVLVPLLPRLKAKE